MEAAATSNVSPMRHLLTRGFASDIGCPVTVAVRYYYSGD